MSAILIVGDEILNGSVKDVNSGILIEWLQTRGHAVGEIRFVQDNVANIMAACAELCAQWDYVFVTGGIGPTHDDVTAEGIARAFGVGLEQHPEMVDYLGSVHSTLIPPVLRMAMLPKGAEVFYPSANESPPAENIWPLVKIENCFILPGPPHAMQKTIELMAKYIAEQPRRWVGELRTDLTESRFAIELAAVQEKYPDVVIGSYIIIGGDQWKVRITCRGMGRDEVEHGVKAVRDVIAGCGGKIDRPAIDME